FTRSQLQHIFTTTNLLPYRLLRIERATLIDISQHDSLTFAYRARVGLFLFRDHAKKRRLARAVWTNHADDSARRQREVHVVNQKVPIVAFADVFRFDHDVAESWTSRNVNLQILAPLFILLSQQIFVRVDPRL